MEGKLWKWEPKKRTNWEVVKSLAVSAAGVPWGLDNSKAEASLGKVVGLEDGRVSTLP